jgi:hypothetical protein
MRQCSHDRNHSNANRKNSVDGENYNDDEENIGMGDFEDMLSR